MCPLWKHEDLTPMMINGFEYELMIQGANKKNGTVQNYNGISIGSKKTFLVITSWWAESVDSVLMVAPELAGLFKLLARLTIVATVLQYKALARAFLV